MRYSVIAEPPSDDGVAHEINHPLGAHVALHEVGAVGTVAATAGAAVDSTVLATAAASPATNAAAPFRRVWRTAGAWSVLVLTATAAAVLGEGAEVLAVMA